MGMGFGQKKGSWQRWGRSEREVRRADYAFIQMYENAREQSLLINKPSENCFITLRKFAKKEDTERLNDLFQSPKWILELWEAHI